jgi:hypothetical protein
MRYYIEIGTINKAKQDIDEVCRREGFTNLTRHNFGSGGVGRFMTKLVSVAGIALTLKKGDMLLLQYPMKKFYKIACTLAHWKKANVVTVIHDLGAFRRHKLTPEQENRRLSKTDFLIVHNPTMRNYLLEHGFKGGIHCLQIFDYLSDSIPADYVVPHRPWRLVYAGNLGLHRNAFLYQMDKCIEDWEMDLYGKGFNTEKNHSSHLHYHGFMPSDEFIATAEADFGLVWDGDSTEECTGDWGEYLRINDPHKTSFYLRAGIPVIVWKQAAMAPFIEQQRVGMAVEGISEIGKLLSALTPNEYQNIKTQAREMGKRLNEGYYFKAGLQAADDYLNSRTR